MRVLDFDLLLWGVLFPVLSLECAYLRATAVRAVASQWVLCEHGSTLGTHRSEHSQVATLACAYDQPGSTPLLQRFTSTLEQLCA